MDIETDTFCSKMFSFNPVHPTKLYYIDREQTFENWPRQIAQKPQHLIQNGFFYTGIGDRVTCFYCGVTVKQWEASDCVETEHQKWEPNCLFAKMVTNKQDDNWIVPCLASHRPKQAETVLYFGDNSTILGLKVLATEVDNDALLQIPAKSLTTPTRPSKQTTTLSRPEKQTTTASRPETKTATLKQSRTTIIDSDMCPITPPMESTADVCMLKAILYLKHSMLCFVTNDFVEGHTATYNTIYDEELSHL
ncbi:BIRC7_8 [Mytilus coruscus]|uniref:BIRC7_8 n=1 Tax=Mytilus coruscus TaxID=42192 RepID=A0A6J8EPX9_MYTCO|nr:BIRC7_8 [Mytilus coruscus]